MVSPWVTPDDLGPRSDSPFAFEACQTASYLLWSLSGRKYQGVTTVTEVYEYPPEYCAWPYRALLYEGDVYNVSARSFDMLGGFGGYGAYPGGNGAMSYFGGCCAGGEAAHLHLRLRGRPVRSVTEVRLWNGDYALDPSRYWLEDRAVLAISGVATLQGTQVTYSYGGQVPMAGRRAARYLAEQFVLCWECSDECELPERVTSVTRQGVQFQLLDNNTIIDDMRTGVYAVDLFLKAVNPDNARRKSRVFSPDLPKGRRIARHTPTPEQIGPHDIQLIPGQPCHWDVELDEVGGGLLDTGEYQPRAQISTWNGAVLYEIDENHFSIADGILTCHLTAEDTSRARLSGQGTWDLYATLNADEKTFIHLLTSNIWLTSHSAA